jgi:hypothetical protein
MSTLSVDLIRFSMIGQVVAEIFRIFAPEIVMFYDFAGI